MNPKAVQQGTTGSMRGSQDAWSEQADTPMENRQQGQIRGTSPEASKAEENTRWAGDRGTHTDLKRDQAGGLETDWVDTRKAGRGVLESLARTIWRRSWEIF